MAAVDKLDMALDDIVKVGGKGAGPAATPGTGKPSLLWVVAVALHHVRLVWLDLRKSALSLSSLCPFSVFLLFFSSYLLRQLQCLR